MYYIIIIHRVNINLPIHLQSLVNFELDRFMIFKTTKNLCTCFNLLYFHRERKTEL